MLFFRAALKPWCTMGHGANLPLTRGLRLFLMFFAGASNPGECHRRLPPTHFSQVNQYLTGGILRRASQHAECGPWYILDGKLDRLVKPCNFKVGSVVGRRSNTGSLHRSCRCRTTLSTIFSLTHRSVKPALTLN